MSKHEHYSPHPPSAYTVEVDGIIQGLGMHHAFNNNPGAWNVFWMSSNIMDCFLQKQEYPDQEYPYTSKLLPMAVGTAYQNLSDDTEVGNLTLQLNPKEWVDKIINDSALTGLILYRIYGISWIEKIVERAAEWETLNRANIIKVNFKR